MHIDDTIHHNLTIGVIAIEQFFPGKHPARRRYEGLQEFEFKACEIDGASGPWLPCVSSGSKIKIAMDPSGRRRWLRGRSAPEDGLDPGHQFPGTERLDHIIVRTQGQAQDPIKFLFPGSKHENGNIAMLSQLAAYLPPIHFGAA